MTRFRSLAAGIISLIAVTAAPLLAATATAVVGGLGSAHTDSVSSSTLIDLTHPATAAGDFTAATIYWASGGASPCASAFKLRFYRPDNGNPTNFAILDERGPFDASVHVSAFPGVITVPLSPPVALQKGDLIGVVELLGATCGSAALTASDSSFKTLVFFGNSDASPFTVCDNSASLWSQALSLMAYAGGTEARNGIVTGVGSVHGAAGSSFKTSMQLLNPSPTPISGRLVFHAQGHAGSPADPSLPYSLSNFQVLSIPDVVDALGAAGLGSIDVIPDSSYSPLVLTHVFNDAGAAGTAGFTEPTVRSGDQFVLEENDETFLVAPPDLTRYRMNIGVRTLSEGATININGHVYVFPADFFDQRAAADFAGSISENKVISVSVTSGKAIFYSVNVDNTTNDTSFTLASRTRF